ncbi:MAG: TerB family tellurite resistance protein [Actinomycetota bacterium]
MLLIWGFRARTKMLSEGVFYSPAAGGDAPYKLLEAKRWFTFFFIPLIPLNTLGTFVECQATKATYDPKILDNPTNAQFTDQLSLGLREVVAAVAAADGAISEAEERLAVAIVGRQIQGYDVAAFRADVAQAGVAPLDQRLVYLAGALNAQGKESLLGAAATIMASDGAIDERDRAEVERIGSLLTMSPAHVKGIIATAHEQSLAP